MKKRTQLKPRLPSDYKSTISLLTDLISQSHHNTIRLLNRSLIDLYWQIGAIVVEKQEKSGWGEEIVNYLAEDIQSRFSYIKGLSSRNLWRMRRFYLAYRDDRELQTLIKDVGWSHNNIIVELVDAREEREFYLRMCIRERWIFQELQKQIRSHLFERFAFAKDPEEVIPVLPTKVQNLDKHFKDEYLFDFLHLTSGYSERDLCKALVSHIREFIRELGRGFMFGGEEYVVRVGNEEFRIDMLFFHRQLQCLVAVEFKLGKFKPEYLGQLEFYLAALDEKETLPHETPAVGLLLCKGKDNDVVRVALSRTISPIKVASYKTGLPDEKLLSQKLHALQIPDEAYQEEAEEKQTLYDILMQRRTITPSQARQNLHCSTEKLRRQVRQGQRQGWLKVTGRGRATCYFLQDKGTKP